MSSIDETDKRILRELQRDSTLSMDDLSERVNLSRNACWRRVKNMQASGIIRGSMMLLDADKLGCNLAALVFIRAANHDPDWLEEFRRAIATIPNIVEAYRMSGDLDYMLKVRVTDMPAYDRFYQKLIRAVPLADVSASFVMEELKENRGIPLDAN
jgi:Lrp/AsnC family transcriptional regulator